jgi:cytochrome c-type protein NapC
LLPTTTIASLAVAALLAAVLYFGVAALGAHRWGRVSLLAGLVVLPLLVTATSLGTGFHESSRTQFCLSCHEMQRYGRSLFADNRLALSAAHYQNRLIDRDQTCYGCHKDYALFGDVKAKLNGLRHVWVHYLGRVPEKIALYEPYKSRNCLHCHDDARRFQENPVHRPILGELYGGARSCLGCHSVAHDMKSVDANQLWQAVGE